MTLRAEGSSCLAWTVPETVFLRQTYGGNKNASNFVSERAASYGTTRRAHVPYKTHEISHLLGRISEPFFPNKIDGGTRNQIVALESLNVCALPVVEETVWKVSMNIRARGACLACYTDSCRCCRFNLPLPLPPNFYSTVPGLYPCRKSS